MSPHCVNGDAGPGSTQKPWRQTGQSLPSYRPRRRFARQLWQTGWTATPQDGAEAPPPAWCSKGQQREGPGENPSGGGQRGRRQHAQGLEVPQTRGVEGGAGRTDLGSAQVLASQLRLWGSGLCRSAGGHPKARLSIPLCPVFHHWGKVLPRAVSPHTKGPARRRPAPPHSAQPIPRPHSCSFACPFPLAEDTQVRPWVPWLWGWGVGGSILGRPCWVGWGVALGSEGPGLALGETGSAGPFRGA